MAQAIFLGNPILDGDQVIFVNDIGGDFYVGEYSEGGGNTSSAMQPLCNTLFCTHGKKFTVKVTDTYDQLTDRERDVLKLLAEGYTNRDIAKMLIISPKTVEGHKTSLMSKLDLHSRVELVKYALKKGIITV